MEDRSHRTAFKTVIQFAAVALGLMAWPSGYVQAVGIEVASPWDSANGKHVSFPEVKEPLAALGQKLFYDPILSGNKNISCGTCHNHDLASADGQSLGVGEGGEGLGKDRVFRPGLHMARVPRSAPSLFNLGADGVKRLFHDGRLEIDDFYANGFVSPATDDLPTGLTSLTAAQAMFPVTSFTEMAGDPEENEVAAASLDDMTDGEMGEVWRLLTARIVAIDAYEPAIADAYPDLDLKDLTYVHLANAIGEFINGEWRTVDSPFDRDELSAEARIGRDLFFGRANCSSCHSGALFTDQEFHALGIPPIGPGAQRKFEQVTRDVGRMRFTNDLADAYAFRTPSLRNVALTAPYGHNGAYATLEGIIRHHARPVEMLAAWTSDEVRLPEVNGLIRSDYAVLDNEREMARLQAAITIEPMDLSDEDIDALVAFLETLTDEDGVNGRLGKPDTVPSGLPVD
ncbi:MAG: cytochrome c peroxidase [Pseudomonadota bacterium]